MLLLSYHKEHEKAQTCIRSSNQLFSDNSNRVISPLLPGDKREGEKKEGEMKENTIKMMLAKDTGPKEYLTGDIKFIITVALGFVVIIMLVYLIPRAIVDQPNLKKCSRKLFDGILC